MLAEPDGRNTWLACNLDIYGYVNHPVTMQSIKISSKVDADTWEELKALARESHQIASGLSTEAIND